MNEDILKNTEYVYSSRIKWGLKRFVCRVSYYTKEPLSDLDYVICSIVSTGDNGIYDKKILGIILGFSIVDNQPEAYYDAAEVKLFADTLTLVESKHLIKVDEDFVTITNLGRICLRDETYYRFFRGRQNIYEHLTFSYPNHTALLMFPFFNDMGIYTALEKGPSYWPDDHEIPSIIGRKPDQLIKRIQLQSKESNNIYEAEIAEYFDVEVKKIPVSLYTRDDEYLPVVHKDEEIAPMATKLFDFQDNALQRENAILECLFKKLWDDKTAILNYDSLEPYFEFVDYEELTKDGRTQWHDERLFEKIVEMANSNCWQNISNNCDIDVLQSRLDEFVNELNWETLTSRSDDDFILNHFSDYPWDLEELSNDTSRGISFIQGLILKGGKFNPEWDWKALEERLEKTFVLSNLPLVDIDLSRYTEDSQEVRSRILNNIEKRWNWIKIESDFDLDFLLSNIIAMQSHLGFIKLFDRVFCDERWSSKYIESDSFKSAVQNNINEDGSLSTILFNQKDYIWSQKVIVEFCKLNLIDWTSTRYSVGFECNPYLVWDKKFFDTFSGNVATQAGCDYVSSHITDENIISDSKGFQWNWSSLSRNENVSTDFVKKHHTLPWDWRVLTERMYASLKLQNLGHPAFIDKWDWSFLSDKLPLEFIEANLQKYVNHWDWSGVLDRIITQSNRLDINWLSSLASVMSTISDTITKKSVWTHLSEEYSYEEFKEILRHTCKDPRFSWDFSMLYKKPEFDIFTDIAECCDFIDWEALSFSNEFNENLAYDPKSGIKEVSWNKDVKQLIGGFEDKWDFYGLSTFNSLNSQDWFLSKYESKLDWKYISLHSSIFAEKDKQKLNEIISTHKKYISFESLSERQDIDIIQIIKIFPEATYDYNTLIANGQYRVNLDDIKKRPRYHWDWKLLSSTDSFKPTDKFLIENIDKDWNWHALSQKDSQKLWTTMLLSQMADDDGISEQVDWMTLTSRQYFPMIASLLLSLPDDKVNWDKISSSDSVMSLLPDLADYLNWKEVSKNGSFPVDDIALLEEYADDLNWNIVCKRDDFIFTNDVLERFTDRIDWSRASEAETIDFTTALIDKFVDYWDWPSLIRNKAFHNKVDFRDKGYFKQENIIYFVHEFPYTPRAYHFTHMSNAVKIIKSHTLQSRNRAEGVFENSAGTNVTITAKAHKYARFYFTSQSPTQFYNECLGKDKHMKYYESARNLGLPKCPMPVFFVIDVEELLTKYPDKCFYSNGNMQKMSTKAFKVIEDPRHIRAAEIYNYRNKEERQQEFLIEDELDISSLSSLHIFCYDEYQRDMLRGLVFTSPLKDKISTCKDLYVRKNRELYFEEDDNTLTTRTDYCNPFEFRINFEKDNVPEIANTENIIREKGGSIFMSRYIYIKKDKPFTVYFEVSEPRKGSWLIYTNK